MLVGRPGAPCIWHMAEAGERGLILLLDGHYGSARTERGRLRFAGMRVLGKRG